MAQRFRGSLWSGPAALGACLIAAGVPQPTEVTVTRVNYKGWPGSIRLANRSAEVVVVPAIGRIMRFAPIGGPNVLWENPELLGKLAEPDRKDWANFGGDKVWPAPQARWGWPPDPDLDGSKWSVRIRPDRALVIESPISKATKLRIRRTIILHRADASLTIRNALINESDLPAEWSVWEVAQMASPDWIRMPHARPSAFSAGYREFPDNPVPAGAIRLHSETIEARRHPAQAYKIGGDPSTARLDVRKGQWVFRMTGPRRSAGTYPDDGCSVEVFSSADPLDYMEAEILGPVVRIPAGKSAELRTTWSLIPARAGR